MKISSLEDEALIRLVAQQNREALGELYDRYNRLVYSLALYMVGDQPAAEEITQDAFTRLWAQADSYRPEQAKVKTWLVTITRNRAIDELRRRKVRPSAVLLEEAWNFSENNLEEKVDGRAQRIRIREALNELPSEQKQVMVMAYFGGYSQTEISNELAMPLGTVKTRMRLAMQKLRQLLNREPEGKSNFR
ncbi:MAG: sigma-70 family RNA polymerase sigma factor [Anaerolineales bacterium]|nr:sigma-70 family RNA polymerase sigma factor [Anaerolineales bacterium]